MSRRLLLTFLLLAAATASQAQNEPLGRLFMTPQQRAALDRERLLGINQRQSQLDSEASYTYNGEVRRSSGTNTRFINGEPQPGAAGNPGIPPGDTFHPATGERESLLGDGRITVKPRPPAP